MQQPAKGVGREMTFNIIQIGIIQNSIIVIIDIKIRTSLK